MYAAVLNFYIARVGRHLNVEWIIPPATIRRQSFIDWRALSAKKNTEQVPQDCQIT